MALLDIDALLEPIPGDDPAGSPVPYVLRTQLEEARKPSDPTDPASGDSSAQPRRIDWAGLIRGTQSILCKQSKDLLVAARLTEALCCEHGFPGLAEGFTLLRRMFDECWERIYPAVDDGDLEVRAAPLNWLGETDRGARFPTTLRGLPLLQGEFQQVSWLDWRRSQDGRGDTESLEQAVRQASREDVYQLTQDIGLALAEYGQLLAVVNQRLGDAAPSMQGLSEALTDCRTLAEQILARKGGPPLPGGDAAADSGDAGLDGQGSQSTGGGRGESGQQECRRAAAARSDAYRRLAEVGEELRILEPHSPVPTLIQTAVRWGGLSFSDLIRVMVQEEGLMGMLSRQSEAGAEEGALQDS